MRACTKKERLSKVSENLESSKARNAEIQKRLSEQKSECWRENLQEKLNK